MTEEASRRLGGEDAGAPSAGPPSAGPPSAEPPTAVPPGREGTISRRGLLMGGGLGLGLGLAGGAAGTWGLTTALRPAPAPGAAETGVGEPVPSRGPHQAGIDRPYTPQRNGLLVVADLDGDPGGTEVLAALAAMGEVVDACTDAGRADPLVLPDGPGDLTVTIGIGPRLVSAIDPALPGAVAMPAYVRDTELDPELTGGDLLVAVHSSDAAALRDVALAVLAAAPGARMRWMQAGVRGAGHGTVVRNPLGYLDGVIVPHGEDELAENVWIAEGPAAGGTVLVVRRLRLDVSAFHTQPVVEQDRVIGRTRVEGRPLSGGEPDDEADLGAKTPEGEFLVPLRSHVRAAHPSFTGSALMLRRGYAFSNAVAPGAQPDEGLLFICFQHDLDVFVRTQHRLDETDDLMDYVTTTASASFLIPPGRTGEAPLGATLAG